MISAVAPVFFNRLARSRRWILLFALVVAAKIPVLAEQENFPVFAGPPPAVASEVDESAGLVLDVDVSPQLAGPVASGTLQSTGALSGRIIFTSGGHGWTWGGSSWVLQRGVTWEMVEDYGNVDQMNFFVDYCFNAGATVVPMRPVGFQTNEVVLDNDDPGVTYVGSWSDSSSAIFFGSPGDVAYRFATTSPTENATATYTPNFPATGFYPVYTWVLSGGNRTSQLYRIRHTGGEARVRVPHHMVGGGWIYLGTYYFEAGANPDIGAVIISNLSPSPDAPAAVVIADAIRFGNGMGSINRGGGVSGYPRQDECSRYWIEAGLGQGQPASIYNGSGDDTSDNVGAPARMAAAMNREAAGDMFKRLYIGFHSNACGCGPNPPARGCTGLYNDPSLSPNVQPNSDTPNQRALATIVSTNVNNTLSRITVPPFEVPYVNNRASSTFARSDFAFGEINNNAINDEFDATIIEVAFHDNQFDALLLRDPKVRNWIGRASYQAAVRYFNQFDTTTPAPLIFLSEPPQNVRAFAVTNGITVEWNPPVPEFSTGTPTGYLVYISTNGYGFGNPVSVTVPTTSFTFTNLATDRDYYFRVAAINAGGESFPSETVGCRRSSNPLQSKILFVNAFDRFDRTTNLRMGVGAQNYTPPGNSGAVERIMPRQNNSFDYVVPHGKAISAFGLPFDSCHRRAITNQTISLANYEIVIWQAGQNLTNNFRATERTVLTTFLNAGGHLFVSGSEIAWELDRATGPTAADRAFLNQVLHADLGSDANNNSASYTVSPAAGSIFSDSGNTTFDNGTRGIYWVQTPDVLTPSGNGARAALNYIGGTGGTAAVQYDGSAGGGRVVYLGFPFETITDAAWRAAFMADILRFFSKRPKLTISQDGDSTRLRLSGEPGLIYTVQTSADFTNWTTYTNISVANGTIEFQGGPVASVSQKFYRAVLLP